jgi:hypothetical protein
VLNKELKAVRSVTDVLKVAGDYPTLGKLKAANGPEKVEALIKAYLVQLTELVNIARPLNATKIDAIAERVVSKYAVLTVADINFVFNAAINGDYGSFYESLDVPKVMTWFATYFEERCKTAAELSQNEAINDKGGNYTVKYATRLLDKLESRNSKPVTRNNL